MRNEMKKWASLITVSSMILLTACGGGGQSSSGTTSAQPASGEAKAAKTDSMTLKLGHLAAETTNYHGLALKFKELVEKKTEGKVKIEVYPNAQLGGDRELMESMQFGNVDLGVITSAPVSNFAPQFNVMDLPYLFKDWDHVNKWIQSDAAKQLMNETEATGLKTFSLMPRGFRHVTNNIKPINGPDDIKGLKLRVLESKLYVDTFTAMGSSPQAMSWSDAYTAMQQKAIDGQENTMDIIHDQRVDEVQTYVSKTGHMAAFAAIMGSKANFDSWPADIQKAIEEAAAEATAILSEENKTKEENYQKKLEEKGMIINEPDRSPFRSMVQGIYDEFISKNGDKYLKEIEKLVQ